MFLITICMLQGREQEGPLDAALSDRERFGECFQLVFFFFSSFRKSSCTVKATCMLISDAFYYAQCVKIISFEGKRQLSFFMHPLFGLVSGRSGSTHASVMGHGSTGLWVSYI